MLKPGDRVVRGPDWKWVDQDLSKETRMPGRGTVIKFENSQTSTHFNVIVIWDNGNTNTYRFSGDCCDIKPIVSKPINLKDFA